MAPVFRLLYDAFIAEHDALHSSVVRQHRDEGVAAARVGELGGRRSAERHQRGHLIGAAIVDGDLVSGLDEVCRHAGAHATQSDKTYPHFNHPSASV